MFRRLSTGQRERNTSYSCLHWARTPRHDGKVIGGGRCGVRHQLEGLTTTRECGDALIPPDMEANDTQMECPHCLKTIHVTERIQSNLSLHSAGTALVAYAGHDGRHHWWLEKIICPACDEFILTVVFSNDRVEHIRGQSRSSFPDAATEQKIPVWPRHTGRSPVPAEVPDEFKRDYQEACLVLTDSSNASAALSRRCLQFILREKLVPLPGRFVRI